jgi:hypothetical protein
MEVPSGEGEIEVKLTPRSIGSKAGLILLASEISRVDCRGFAPRLAPLR